MYHVYTPNPNPEPEPNLKPNPNPNPNPEPNPKPNPNPDPNCGFTISHKMKYLRKNRSCPLTLHIDVTLNECP